MSLARTFRMPLIAQALVLGMIVLPVQAEVQMLREGPNQILFQTRRQLKDEGGQTWQVIAFKHVSAAKPATFQLRLVIFPGHTEPKHPKPAVLSIAGKTSLSLPDITERIGNASAAPIGVSQYDLRSAVTSLQTASAATLSLSMVDGRTAVLKLPAIVLYEWLLVWKANSSSTLDHLRR